MANPPTPQARQDNGHTEGAAFGRPPAPPRRRARETRTPVPRSPPRATRPSGSTARRPSCCAVYGASASVSADVPKGWVSGRRSRRPRLGRRLRGHPRREGLGQRGRRASDGRRLGRRVARSGLRGGAGRPRLGRRLRRRLLRIGRRYGEYAGRLRVGDGRWWWGRGHGEHARRQRHRLAPAAAPTSAAGRPLTPHSLRPRPVRTAGSRSQQLTRLGTAPVPA